MEQVYSYNSGARTGLVYPEGHICGYSLNNLLPFSQPQGLP